MEDKNTIRIGRLYFDREKLLILGLAVLFATPFFLSGKSFGISMLYGMLTFNGVLILFGSLYILAVVGYLIFKGFVKVGAELSLLVLLAQGYCDLAEKLSLSLDAIRALFIFALGYVLFEFAKYFHSSFKELCLKFKEKNGKWSTRGWVVITLLVLFSVYFFALIYQAIMPIFLNICFIKM